MNNKSIQQKFQEDEYKFPYHYLLNYDENVIDVVKRYSYGFIHFSLIYLIKRILIYNQPKSILDIGCGDGKLIYEICKDKDIENSIDKIIGIDPDNRAISFAKIFNENNKAQFLNQDIHQIQQKPFDLILLTEVIEHLEDNELIRFLEKVNSLLGEGKYLLISTPSVNVPLQVKHYRHYNLDTLRSILSNYVKIEKVFYIGSTSFYSKVIKHIYMFLEDFRLPSIKKLLFSYFKKKFLITSEKKCQYIMVLCKK